MRRKIMIIAFIVQAPALRNVEINRCINISRKKLFEDICAQYYGEWIGMAIQTVSGRQLWPPYYIWTFSLAQFFGQGWEKQFLKVYSISSQSIY